jgi:hypothetical protein
MEGSIMSEVAITPSIAFDLMPLQTIGWPEISAMPARVTMEKHFMVNPIKWKSNENCRD